MSAQGIEFRDRQDLLAQDGTTAQLEKPGNVQLGPVTPPGYSDRGGDTGVAVLGWAQIPLSQDELRRIWYSG